VKVTPESAMLPENGYKESCIFFTTMQHNYPSLEKIFSNFHILSCLVMRTHQIRALSNFFCKIWGNFHISPKIGGRGKESNKRILKLQNTPSVCNIVTGCPFAGSEI